MGALVIVILFFVWVFNNCKTTCKDVSAREDARANGDLTYYDPDNRSRSAKTGEIAFVVMIGKGRVVCSGERGHFGEVIEVKGDIHSCYEHNALMKRSHDIYVKSGGKYAI